MVRAMRLVPIHCSGSNRQHVVVVRNKRHNNRERGVVASSQRAYTLFYNSSAETKCWMNPLADIHKGATYCIQRGKLSAQSYEHSRAPRFLPVKFVTQNQKRGI